MLSRVHTQVTHKAIFVFHSINNVRVSLTGSYASRPSPLFFNTLPHLSLSNSPQFSLSLP
ncbi:unnamed protein product [Hymenolepis diminuta]|uniref:Uncharacterized protein n=1 Tax=Hymenolepis diminuta TaxID=6216 RepID=A0A564YBP7_HYMDI|nr:unnamed protein product [Hymenolepis diminuta]